MVQLWSLAGLFVSKVPHMCCVQEIEEEFNYVLRCQVHPFYTLDVCRTTSREIISWSPWRQLNMMVEQNNQSQQNNKLGSKEKELSRGSSFIEFEDSPVLCSGCGKRGLHRRTCPN
jgi:hypothetical protein